MFFISPEECHALSHMKLVKIKKICIFASCAGKARNGLGIT